MQCAVFLDLIGEAIEKMGLSVIGRVLSEFLPLFRLSDENEVENIFGNETKRFIVLIGCAFVAATRNIRTLNHASFTQTAIGFRVVNTACQEQRFNGSFKVFLGDVGQVTSLMGYR